MFTIPKYRKSRKQSKPRSKQSSSYNKAIVQAWLRSNGLPECEFEHRFYPERMWRFDLAWPESKVAIEVQGGIWGYGRHTRGAALLKEWEKINTAASMGWKILYCQPTELCMTVMVDYLKGMI